jgi:hypothetical protein
MSTQQSGQEEDASAREALATLEEVVHDHVDSDLHRQFKVLGCLVGVVYAIYCLFTGLSTNAIFAFILSGFTLLSVIPFTPKRIVSDLKSPFLLLISYAKSLSFRQIVLLMTDIVRALFRRGDSLVRFLLIIISIGGTAVVLKYGIRNFFLPDFIDVWVKRIGPALTLIVIILYPTFRISKRLYIMSMNVQDRVCSRYELAFYVSIVLLCLTILLLFIGLPIETYYHSTRPKDHPTPDVWHYDPDSGWIRYLASIALIWLIWSISFGACIMSRFFEIAWRDQPARNTV